MLKCEVGAWSIQELELCVLSLDAVALGSTPIPTCGQDLFPVVLDSTLPHFVKSQLVAPCELGLLIIFLISLSCFFQIIAPAGFWPLGQNPRRHYRNPRVIENMYGITRKNLES